MPICLHNVSDLTLNMASQQLTAALFNAPLLECTRRATDLRWANPNPLAIKDGTMTVSTRPGLGLEMVGLNAAVAHWVQVYATLERNSQSHSRDTARGHERIAASCAF